MNTPAPLPPAPLPWDWFDLAPPPRDLPAGGIAEIPTADQGGAAITWQTRHDHKTLLARILRQPGSSRPALLLLHGMGLTIATFRGIAPWLLPTHDLILVDYSGLACMHCAPKDHGWGGTIDVQHLVTGLFALLEVLHLPQADFAGNSLGGGTAARFAIRATAMSDADRVAPRSVAVHGIRRVAPPTRSRAPRPRAYGRCQQ